MNVEVKPPAKCGNCRHWKGPARFPNEAADWEYEHDRGECRRYAPHQGARSSARYEWPETERIDWCGEHAP